MKKIAALTLSLFLTYGTALADTPKDADPQPSKSAQPAKPKVAKKAEKADSAIAVQLEELRQAVQSQQEQLQLLKEELAKRDHQIDEAREAAAAANARAAEATSKASEAVNTSVELKSTAATLNNTVSDLKASNEALKTTVATEQAEKKASDEVGPSTIRLKGVNITPGGFIAAETVFRSHAEGADINSAFTGIPYPNSALSHISENNFTARQTRATLLVDTKIGPAKVTGYFEGDFLGTGVTSNNRQSNSYVFRQRQLWASAKFDNGFYIAGGQMWSMVTESKKGIENRQEQFPLQIDPQYVVGWAWQRAYGFRVAKNWDKFALGVGIEGPQTTFGGRGSNNNFFFNTPGAGGGLYNFVDTSGYTANKSPDFMVKATLDPGWGHYEIVGIVSPFRDRVYPCGAQPLLTPATGLNPGCLVAGVPSTQSVFGAFNDSTVGGGFGATARLPFAQKKIEIMGHFQGGDGIGRYSSAQLADVTARPNGTLAPIRSAAYLAELELHPNPKLDVYAYYGGEYAARTAYTFANPATGFPVPVGYGSPLFNNSGCTTEGFPNTPAPPPVFPPPATPGNPSSSGTCNGDIHHIVEGTLGFWHKLYNGPKGRLQWGVQYSYIEKFAWSGNAFNNTTGVTGVSQRPKAIDNMVFTSFRYYIP
jgi:hypothetical protein